MNLLIVEDHPMVQDSLRALAAEAFVGAGIDTAASLAEALAKADEGERPYLVLLDLGLPDCSGLDTLKRWRRAQPEPRVIVLAEAEDAMLAHAAIRGGASGFVPKTYTKAMIAAALQLVAAGGLYVPAHAGSERRAPQPRASIELTERQIEVLRLISRGLRNREIGERLKISEETVKQHARGAYVVLGVSSRTQAMSVVARRGIRLE